VWGIYRAEIWGKVSVNSVEAVHDVDVPHRTLRLRHGMQAWYVRVCWAFCVRGGGEAFEPDACDMLLGLRSACDG
jgi:hypothetical protein